METTKKLIEQSILMAIDSLSNDIQKSGREVDNAKDARSIKLLAEAYDIVHRGRR